MTDCTEQGFVLTRLFSPSLVLAHLRTPLYASAYALIASAAVTSGLGLLYWVLAARLYEPTTLGLNSAVVSAMLFVSGIAQLSLNGVLVRFIPIAGIHAARLVGLAYASCLAAALLASLIFLFGASVWAPWLAPLQMNPVWTISFVLATMAWTIFSLQDSVLTGLRQAQWVPLENSVYAVAKILALTLLAVTFPATGIFISWNLPLLLLLVPVNFFIFRIGIPRHAANINSTRIRARQIVEQAGGNYLGTLFSLGSTTLLPILVTTLAGASANAYFYPPWVIASALQLVALSMATSMTVEAAFDETKLALFARRVTIHTARLVIPCVIVIFIAAPFLLALFGPHYAEQGTTLLRLLALAAIPNLFVAVTIGLARVKNRAWLVTLIQGALCSLGLGLSYFLVPVWGISGVGAAWLSAQSLVALGLLAVMGKRAWRLCFA